jgi:hypothetical protein
MYVDAALFLGEPRSGWSAVRDVNGSDRILLLPYPIPYFLMDLD